MELQVALNFLISFLYNKLPRRRVNHFGEELEKALRVKFQGHWYPEQPFKGSAYRCVKTTPPLDPVFEIAAREAGVDLRDIEENLPQELSIWIDPGEVSYRMSEKGPVKVLYSESDTVEERADREVTKTFNPEAQCFKPVDALSQQMAGLQVESAADCPNCSSASTPNTNCDRCSHSPYSQGSSPPSSYKSVSPTPPSFLNKPTQPALTFTTASFAATKFGSTKLKSSNAKQRNNGQRMSPTEFANYIKQRAIAQQQVAQQQQQLSVVGNLGGNVSPMMFDRPRSLSPHPYGTHPGSTANGHGGHGHGPPHHHPLIDSLGPPPPSQGSFANGGFHGGGFHPSPTNAQHNGNGAGGPFHHCGHHQGNGSMDLGGRSPSRGRAYTMQDGHLGLGGHNLGQHLGPHGGSALHLSASSPNHLSHLAVPSLGGSIGLSTSAGNVSTSTSPQSMNGDFTEFSMPGYSSASSHQLLVASN